MIMTGSAQHGSGYSRMAYLHDRDSNDYAGGGVNSRQRTGIYTEMRIDKPANIHSNTAYHAELFGKGKGTSYGLYVDVDTSEGSGSAYGIYVNSERNEDTDGWDAGDIKTSYGIRAQGTDYGVYGSADSDGYGGYFDNVGISDDLRILGSTSQINLNVHGRTLLGSGGQISNPGPTLTVHNNNGYPTTIVADAYGTVGSSNSTSPVGIGWSTGPKRFTFVLDNAKLRLWQTNSFSYSYNHNPVNNQYYDAILAMTGSRDGSPSPELWVSGSGGGRIGIATEDPLYTLDVRGKARVTSSLAVGNILASATDGRIDASNDIVAFSTSDIRFKENVMPISDALFKVQQIRGVEFDWIPNEEFHGFEGHDVGVIAQEVEEVLPEVVQIRKSGYKAVKYEKIIPLLVESIKEQQIHIEKLEKRIKKIEES
jgi:hypothetical protein